MDRSPYSPSSSDSSQASSSFSSPTKGSSVVLSIDCLKGSSKADEWSGDMLQTGDIVEELRIGNIILRSPFKNGKSGVNKILHTSFKQKETSIKVWVRRGPVEYVELQACIVPGDQYLGKKHYVLRAIDDPNYAVAFVDRTETECLNLQASRTTRMVCALERTPLQDGYVSYPWEKRMHEMLSVPNSSSFYSILFLPKASDKGGNRYNDLEDTLARANSWINASQALGAPIVFMSVQTESLLTKISGDTASSRVNANSLSDLANLANTSLYGFEDYHGVDIGVVRAVRMWFAPISGEALIEIKISDDDAKLGFTISRTEEGFIYVSSVVEGDDSTPSARSGLSNLYKQACRSSMILVVCRISNQKVLPWMVSPTGAIRCFDTVSLSQKLSLHRHARVPILMHVFLWDRNTNSANVGSIRARVISRCPPTLHPSIDNQVMSSETDSEGEIEPDIVVAGDFTRDFSFRFHDVSINSKSV